MQKWSTHSTGYALQRAVVKNDVSAIRSLLAKEGLERTRTGCCDILQEAIEKSRFEIASVLIEEFGADASQVNKNKQTALHIAVENSNATNAFARLLIVKGGASVNAKDEEQKAPFLVAIKTKQVRLAEMFLCEFDADPSLTDSRGRTALHLVAKRKCFNLEFTKLFISKMKGMASLNAVTAQGYTPLHIAVLHRNYEMACYLLETFGAQLIHFDDESEGDTARSGEEGKGNIKFILHDALRSTSFSRCGGHDYEYGDGDDEEERNGSKRHNDLPSPELVRLLVEKGGCDVNRVGEVWLSAQGGVAKGTPLFHLISNGACDNSFFEILTMLVEEFGADPSIRTPNGVPLLVSAAEILESSEPESDDNCELTFLEVVRILTKSQQEEQIPSFLPAAESSRKRIRKENDNSSVRQISEDGIYQRFKSALDTLSDPATPWPFPLPEVKGAQRSLLVNQVSTDKGFTVINRIAENSHRAQSCALLITILVYKFGADLSISNIAPKSKERSRPLLQSLMCHCGAEFKVQFIRFVIHAGSIDVNYEDGFGNTALMYAISASRFEEAMLLIRECNADVMPARRNSDFDAQWAEKERNPLHATLQHVGFHERKDTWRDSNHRLANDPTRALAFFTTLLTSLIPSQSLWKLINDRDMTLMTGDTPLHKITEIYLENVGFIFRRKRSTSRSEMYPSAESELTLLLQSNETILAAIRSMIVECGADPTVANVRNCTVLHKIAESDANQEYGDFLHLKTRLLDTFLSSYKTRLDAKTTATTIGDDDENADANSSCADLKSIAALIFHKNAEKQTALQTFVVQKRIPFVHVLLDYLTASENANQEVVRENWNAAGAAIQNLDPDLALRFVGILGVGINYQDGRGRTLLHTALEPLCEMGKGDVKGRREKANPLSNVLPSLLRLGSDPSIADKKKRTALHLVASFRNEFTSTALLDTLLSPYVDEDKEKDQAKNGLTMPLSRLVNLEDEDGDTPLHLVLTGRRQCPQYLYPTLCDIAEKLVTTYGALVGPAANSSGRTALHCACACPFATVDLIKAMLLCCSRGDLNSSPQGEQLPHLKTDDKDDDSDDANDGNDNSLGNIINAKDAKGMTALHVAIEANATAIAIFLSQHPSIDLSRADNKGDTPLRMAVRYPTTSIELLRVLLRESHIHVNASIRMNASMNGASTFLLHTLLHWYQASNTSRFSWGRIGSSADHQNSLVDKFRMMVNEFGADPTLVDSFGRTVLHLIVSLGSTSRSAHALLADLIKKPDGLQTGKIYSSCVGIVNAKDKMGRTPLRTAISQKPGLVIDSGAFRTGGSDHSAVDGIANCLLKHGADPIWHEQEETSSSEISSAPSSDCNALHVITRRNLNEYTTCLFQTIANAIGKERIDQQDADGNTALHLITIALVESGADFSAPLNHHTSLRKFWCELASILVNDLEANASITNNMGLTPLHILCGYAFLSEFTDPAPFQTLLEAKNGPADVNATDYEGKTILHRLFESHDFYDDFSTNEPSSTILSAHFTIRQKIGKTAKKFVELGVDVNRADHNGRTALHIALCRGSITHDTLVYLIEECGAFVNHRDHKGNTPLFIAVKETHTSDYYERDNDGDHGDQHWGREGGGSDPYAIAKILIVMYGADVTIINNAGQSIIHLAIERMHSRWEEGIKTQPITRFPTPSFLQFLFQYSRIRGLQLGINQQTFIQQESPLHVLLNREYGDEDYSDDEAGSDLGDDEDVFTRTEDDAKRNSQKRLVFMTRLFLVNGADTTLQNAKGWTPLHLAADSTFYSKSLWKVLIENGGAPINAKAGEGMTPLRVATVRTNIPPSAIKLLVKETPFTTSSFAAANNSVEAESHEEEGGEEEEEGGGEGKEEEEEEEEEDLE